MEELLRELFIIALLSTVVTFICAKVRIPALVGFLFSGVLLGPYALGLVKNLDAVNILSEIGVVFLLFSIGLQFSTQELVQLRKQVFIGGTLQVFLSIAVFAGLSLWIVPSIGFGSAILFGFLLALSSSAIVLKILQETGQIGAPYGRFSFAILIFQDLVVVPMMIALPVLAGVGETDFLDMHQILVAFGTLALIVSLFILARKLIPFLITFIVRTGSHEIFLISVIGICLGTAYLTYYLGLSLAFGAFFAGIIVAESEYSASAFEEILPFRDVFTSIFFISVGMLLNASFFWAHLGTISVLVLLVILLKGVIAGGVVLLMRYPLRPAIMVGFALCQVGEFAFVLAKSGLKLSLLSEDQYQLFLATSIVTMAATPFLIKLAPVVAALWKSNADNKDCQEHIEAEKLNDHLIVIGYGVGGRLLGKAALAAGIPYIIMEMNPDTVHTFAAKGEPIFYGDATHKEALRNLGIAKARVLCVVISDPAATRHIVEIARQLNPTLHILVRTRFMREVGPLQELGASEVIPEEFETAIEVFTRVLYKYLVPRGEIEEFTANIRATNYQRLRENAIQEFVGTLKEQLSDLTITSFIVDETAPLVGIPFKDANLRQKANITVIAVKRGETLYPHPGGDFSLHPKDIVYIFSSPRDAVFAAPLFTSGA